MATIIFIDDDGAKVEISREIDANYGDLVNLFYSLSLALSYSPEVVDKYLDCEYNDFAVSNNNGGDDNNE